MPLLRKLVDGRYQEYALPKGQSLIGRGALVSFLAVSSQMASKRHAIVECDDSGCTITDDSRNGTVINGLPIQKKKTTHLRHDDKIVIADVTFVYSNDNDSGAIPTITVLGTSDDSENDSVRKQLVTVGGSPSTVAFKSSGRISLEKIRGKFVLSDQSPVTLATTEPIQKLSHVLQFIEVIRTYQADGGVELLVDIIYELFPQGSQLVVATEIDLEQGTYRLCLSANRTSTESAIVCEDMIRHVASTCEAILVRDQWRNDREDLPKLSTMVRVSVLCVPLMRHSKTCTGAMQLISTDPRAEFEIHDLERLAILAQLLTIVLPQHTCE